MQTRPISIDMFSFFAHSHVSKSMFNRTNTHITQNSLLSLLRHLGAKSPEHNEVDGFRVTDAK